jgi:hypothetical protein
MRWCSGVLAPSRTSSAEGWTHEARFGVVRSSDVDRGFVLTGNTFNSQRE